MIRRTSNERGASNAEYATLLSLIALVVVSGASQFGNHANDKLSQLNISLASNHAILGRNGNDGPTIGSTGDDDGTAQGSEDFGGGTVDFGQGGTTTTLDNPGNEPRPPGNTPGNGNSNRPPRTRGR